MDKLEHSELDKYPSNWESFATMKRYRKQVILKSKTKEFNESTYKKLSSWLIRYMKFTHLNPDQLIEEGINESEDSEQRLAEFYQYSIKNGSKPNSAITGVYGYIRGFYTKNKVNTTYWKSPQLVPAEVEKTDANYPLFVKNQDTGKLDLNREFLQPFFRKMNPRDEIIGLCMMSSGLDISEILKINIGDVIYQSGDRILLHGSRMKTGEIYSTFLSKEATAKVRKYIKAERVNALDDDPLFSSSSIERRQRFSKIYGRKYSINDIEPLPKANKISIIYIERRYRIIQEQLGIRIQRNKQSPLRPKRLRKIFESASQRAGITQGITDVFMGHKGSMSKVYLGKSREELETYYEQVEPFLTLYELPHDVTESLRRENIDMQSQIDDLSSTVRDLVDHLSHNKIVDIPNSLSNGINGEMIRRAFQKNDVKE